MALLAEEIVQEWMNRQGYFTIRGIHLGVHEIDLLAIRPTVDGLECRHIEVQASVRPVSYISRVPKSVQREEGRAATSAKERTPEELRQGVREWIDKKFDLARKRILRDALAPGPWTRELVVHHLKHPTELEYFREAGVETHLLPDIIRELRKRRFPVPGAAGAAFVDLVLLEESASSEDT